MHAATPSIALLSKVVIAITIAIGRFFVPFWYMSGIDVSWLNPNNFVM